MIRIDSSDEITIKDNRVTKIYGENSNDNDNERKSQMIKKTHYSHNRNKEDEI